MDGDRFDALTRRLATGTTRRAALRALAGSAAGLLSLAGAARTLGQTCRAAGSLCTKDANCCSGLCDTANPDPRQRNKCVCPPGQENCRGVCKAAPIDYLGDVLNCGACGNRCPVDQCNRATCVQGVCGLEPDPKRIGKACDDGNCCTENDVCHADGTCGGTPITCRAPEVCEEPGVCNPGTCQCDFAFKPPSVVCRPAAGPCDVAEHCTGSSPTCPADAFRPPDFPCGAGPSCAGGVQHAQDACDGSGNCVPGANTPCGLYACGPTACRTSCDSDAHCVPAAHCDGSTCLADLPLGADCDEDSDCASGFCNPVSGFCCAEDCPEGVACSDPGFACDEFCGGQICEAWQVCRQETCVDVCPDTDQCATCAAHCVTTIDRIPVCVNSTVIIHCGLLCTSHATCHEELGPDSGCIVAMYRSAFGGTEPVQELCSNHPPAACAQFEPGCR